MKLCENCGKWLQRVAYHRGGHTLCGLCAGVTGQHSGVRGGIRLITQVEFHEERHYAQGEHQDQNDFEWLQDVVEGRDHKPSIG